MFGFFIDVSLAFYLCGEAYSLKLEHCMVEAQLYSPFVQLESIEDGWTRKVVYCHVAEGQVGVRGVRTALRLLLIAGKDFCQWTGHIIFGHRVNSLVLYAFCAFQAPGETDDAFSQDRFGGPEWVEVGEDAVPVQVKVGLGF